MIERRLQVRTSRCASASTGAAWTRTARARLMDENARCAAAAGCGAGDARSAGRVRDRQRAARRGTGLARRSHHAVVQGQRRAGPDRGLHANSRARCDYPLHLGLTEAGMGSKGIVASTAALARAAAAGHRRHHPRIADTRARRRSHARGDRRAGDPADHGPALVHAAGHRLSRLRAHDQHRVPGTGAEDRRLTCARRCRCGARSIPASKA